VHSSMRTCLAALLASQFCVCAFAQRPCKSTVVGDLHIARFQSKMYGETFKVRVWLPPGYNDTDNAKREYPTLYLLDRQTAFDECTAFHGEHELQIDEAVTKLIGEHAISPMIVVGVDSTRHRDYQYSPYPSSVTDPAAPEPIESNFRAFSPMKSYRLFPHVIECRMKQRTPVLEGSRYPP
jgi:hypothetical protein